MDEVIFRDRISGDPVDRGLVGPPVELVSGDGAETETDDGGAGEESRFAGRGIQREEKSANGGNGEAVASVELEELVACDAERVAVVLAKRPDQKRTEDGHVFLEERIAEPVRETGCEIREDVAKPPGKEDQRRTRRGREFVPESLDRNRHEKRLGRDAERVEEPGRARGLGGRHAGIL